MKQSNYFLLAAACAALICAGCKQATSSNSGSSSSGIDNSDGGSTPTVTYSVTFNTNGGSSISVQTVETGKKAMEPVAPTKSGYLFDGWYSDENCTTAFNFAAAITKNTTLYAKWKVRHVAGDILLDDGTWVLKDDVVTLDAATLGTRKAVGVLAFEKGGKAYCVGIDIGLFLVWAKDETLACTQNIIAIQESDIDGSDNWNEIVKIYKENGKTESDALADCDAFKWAKEYGDGWYIPSIYELKQVYNNKEAISYSLAMLFNIVGSGCKIRELEKAWYWTGNQFSSADKQAMLVTFVDGDAHEHNKSDDIYVLVVRGFDY